MLGYFDTRYARCDRRRRIPMEGSMERRSGVVESKLVLRYGLVLRCRLGVRCRQEERMLAIRSWGPVEESRELLSELVHRN